MTQYGTCERTDCDCTSFAGSGAARFCRSCGHPRDAHATIKPERPAERSGACLNCRCTEFTGDADTRFCTACGHEGNRHIAVPRPPREPRPPLGARWWILVACCVVIPVLLATAASWYPDRSLDRARSEYLRAEARKTSAKETRDDLRDFKRDHPLEDENEATPPTSDVAFATLPDLDGLDNTNPTTVDECVELFSRGHGAGAPSTDTEASMTVAAKPLSSHLAENRCVLQLKTTSYGQPAYTTCVWVNFGLGCSLRAALQPRGPFQPNVDLNKLFPTKKDA